MSEVNTFLKNASAKGISMGLDTMRSLTTALGNPQNKPKNIIHIAGTNGKGSVGAFIESVLISAGYSVGRYSSPAVFSRFEIFKKNGICITESEYLEYMDKIQSVAEITPTIFEAETALAFLWFKDCDYCIIEVGLGGRLDATNVIDSNKIAVLTSISLDHMNILGSSLEDITAEKCGIFNTRTQVISTDQVQSVKDVIISKAKSLPLKFSDKPQNICFDGEYQSFDYKDLQNIKISLLGSFQPANAALAIEVLKSLNISEKYIREGLKSTVWHGRFDVISRSPMIIADGAHNRNAFSELAKSLKTYFPNRKFTFVTGVLADKEYTEAARILSPLAERVFTITPDNARALNNKDYAAEFKKYGIDAVPTTLSEIHSIADKDKITVAFGSLSFMKTLFNEVNNGTNRQNIAP